MKSGEVTISRIENTDRKRDSWFVLMRRLVPAIVIGLLAVHAALLAWGAYRHSPTLNEPAHLAAGVSHWQLGRFDLYRVNPPLVRMVAALPVLAVGCETDWSQFREGPRARPEFGIGRDFVAANGARSLWLFTIARWACIPLSLIGALCCFCWGRALYGRPAGVLSLSLWCFEPNMIAHGQLITPDAAATSFGLVAGFLFWRWLKHPTWKRAGAAGIGLSLAQLAKMSWFFLFCLWPALWLIWSISARRSATRCASGSTDDIHRAHDDSPPDTLPPFRQLAVILLLGWYLLNLGYGFDGTFTQLKEYTFVSRTMSGHPDSRGSNNRFANTWLGEIPMPLPKQYVLGMDIQKWDFETPQFSYLRGEWKEGGWWYYYLYGLAVKVPHGTQLLIVLALMIAVRSWFRSAHAARDAIAQTSRQRGRVRSPHWRDELVLLAPALVLFALVSSQTAFNHHFRYVLPALGILLVSSGGIFRVASGLTWWPVSGESRVHHRFTDIANPFVQMRLPRIGQLLAGAKTRIGLLLSGRRAMPVRESRERKAPQWRQTHRAILLMVAIVGVACSAISSAAVYPHSLSYFNELAGGPQQGHRHLLHSNLDWGQDLLFLLDWLREHPQAEPVHITYYGGFNPRAVGVHAQEFPVLPPADSRALRVPADDFLPRGWYAVTVAYLHGPPPAVVSRFSTRVPRHEVDTGASLLRALEPIARIGYTINVYYVPADE